ncbi:conserved domain protein [Klebsiella sp. MS 92-3]|nr:conserved domain protein [Klebsiella sp. MS 92-3]
MHRDEATLPSSSPLSPTCAASRCFHNLAPFLPYHLWLAVNSLFFALLRSESCNVERY